MLSSVGLKSFRLIFSHSSWSLHNRSRDELIYIYTRLLAWWRASSISSLDRSQTVFKSPFIWLIVFWIDSDKQKWIVAMTFSDTRLVPVRHRRVSYALINSVTPVPPKTGAPMVSGSGISI